jgi:predicted HTH domain antitoxin
MRQHAVATAISLYQDGTLTLDQAAGYAGVTPGTMRERLRNRGIACDESASQEGEPALVQ